MSAIARGFAGRFAHPRLAFVGLAGVALVIVGGVGWLAPGVAEGVRVTALRVMVLGYLLALAGGSGYVAFAAFEFRDEKLR